jgi:transcription-repair coupling factor (superfamily II helicase)
MINYLGIQKDQSKSKSLYKDLYGCALSLAISDLINTNNLTVVIASNTNQALMLEEELSYVLSDKQVWYFPDWETLPYDTFSPYQDIISKRLEILTKISRMKNSVVILTASCAQTKVAPRTFINQNALTFKIGEKLDLPNFTQELISSGYIKVKQVLEHGEFAIRGSIIDLFPMGSNSPFRIDLFDDEIDTIAIFDLETQRSVKTINSINVLPAHEFPTDEESINTFRKNYRNVFKPTNIAQHTIYQQISKKNLPAGIEYYLPLFFEQTETFFDYLPSDTRIIMCDISSEILKEFYDDAYERSLRYLNNPDHPSLDVRELFLSEDILNLKIKDFDKVKLFTNEQNVNGKSALTKPLPTVAIHNSQTNQFEQLENFIKSFKGKILFTAPTEGRKTIIADILRPVLNCQEVEHLNTFIESSKDCKPSICCAPFHEGILTKDFAIITESQLFGASYSIKRKRKSSRTINPDAIIKNLAELYINDYVVHEQYGIAKYLGLETLKIDNQKAEFVKLEFAQEAKLFVPITHLHLLSRYLGKEEATLTKLGTDAWKKARNKALNKIKDVAASLLDIYAKRSLKQGFAYKLNEQEYNQFAQGFGYQPTEDQEKAFEAVINDMISNQPMDRLICGDVGFGKTEVAMRAAFIAASNGKQVAILVPTTILADQHYDNFKERFANTPITVSSISRFVNESSQKKILEAAKDGQVDILIGTHKLLSKSLKFKDLGLLIIDEEHRFGVSQKEKIKELRAEVDILTMTATPIPRTLNLAMNGVRDLTIIAQPPAKRLAVRTFVHQCEDALIKEAILRELKRGGQTYFLHNDVRTIVEKAKELSELIPEAKVAVAHAQLPEKELARIMHDFYHQRINLLVCSTIIETGLDVPSANTILINRADKLGLAQLHQLRGRVGRSHHQAYAYLLTPAFEALNPDSKKRLDAISNLEELGSGFILATHDLEIRGAGEILGSEQSGQIEGIGFNLYSEMLNDAIEALKEGKEISLETISGNEVNIELHIPVLFPDVYIFDVNTRLSLYKRLSSCSSFDEIDDFKAELIDRFGILPPEALNLIEIANLKLIAKKLGICNIEFNSRGGSITFGEKINVKFEFLTGLVASNFDKYRPAGSNGLKIIHETENAKDRLQFIKDLLYQMNENYLQA